jgi:hypothetical protein
MKHIKVCLVLFSFLIIATGLTGCIALLAGGAAGAGSAVYIKGQLKEDFSVSVATAHTASVAALKELNLPIIEDNFDKLTAKMKSRFADGNDVWIDIEYITLESSKLTIRVGILGDERKARQILDAIHNHIPPAKTNSQES